ncbi:hypothetical protein B0H13DRAFT_2359438 [Mycena leptocephala]|nr:hypothetical protein B0H13DRAFT_2359438 [Mycena leptocephala]
MRMPYTTALTFAFVFTPSISVSTTSRTKYNLSFDHLTASVSLAGNLRSPPSIPPLSIISVAQGFLQRPTNPNTSAANIAFFQDPGGEGL